MDAISVASEVEPVLIERERPYAPSWVNRLIWAVDGLPGPSWAWYLGAALVGILISNAQGWLATDARVGELTPMYTYYGVLNVALLAALAWLDRVAHTAVESFRPAVPDADERFDALAYELTIIPARPTWILTIVFFAITPLYYLADPVGTHTDGLSTPTLVIRFFAEGLTTVLFVVLAYHTLRQLRAVDRLHRLVRHVDLFRPAPLYAFSTLTFRTSLVLLGLLFSSLLADPSAWADMSPVLILPWALGLTGVALVAFILPLRGMHAVILAEKIRLQQACGKRLTEVTGAVHAAVDADDLTRADGLNKLLASLVAERDLVSRLSTWPWQPGQLGAIVSAILLPIGLFLMTRFLERVV